MLKKPAPSAMHSESKRPVHQSVYEDLRDQVLYGDLAPGQAVTIQGLVDVSGAGVTPVREAIRRLIANGALKMMGNRRVAVPTMAESDIEQLEFMRKSIEPHLAGLAFERAGQSLIPVLAKQDRALNEAISQGDTKSYLLRNYQFHSILNEAACAPILKATVDRLWLRFGPSLRVVCGRHGTLNLPDKHADLIAAFAAGDKSAVEKAMCEDVEQGMTQIREALLTQTLSCDSIDMQ